MFIASPWYAHYTYLSAQSGKSKYELTQPSLQGGYSGEKVENSPGKPISIALVGFKWNKSIFFF